MGGQARGRYLKYCDTGRKAVLTCIFYLNESWEHGDHGELRLFEDGIGNTQVKYDVSPIANRLLMFWATDECPHEVLATHRDRYAMTTWLLDGRQCLEHSTAGSEGHESRFFNLLNNADIITTDIDEDDLAKELDSFA